MAEDDRSQTGVGILQSRGHVAVSRSSSLTFSTPDIVPPEVEVVSPAPDTPIYSQTEVIVRVTDDSGLFRSIILWVLLDDKSQDKLVIHDGVEFSHRFRTSYRLPITGGWEYTIRATPSWPAPPRFYAEAVDQGGNEAT